MQNSNLRYWFGLIFIIIGIMLTIENFSSFYFGFHHIIFSWHTIFIIIGIILVIRSRRSTVGLIFILIGAYGLLNHILFPAFNLSLKDLLPLIIIIIGFYFILKRNNKRIRDDKRAHYEQHINSQKISDDYIDETCLLAHYKRKIDSKNFKGGRLTIIAAGINIDLTECVLSSGENTLDITCLAGGFTILIPQNWKVITNVTTILGGLDTKNYVVNNSLTQEGILIIKGTILFGGGEIKSII